MSSRRLPKVIAVGVLLAIVLVAVVTIWSSKNGGGDSSGLKYRSLMAQAKRLAAQGRVEEVERLCREAIAIKADRPDAFLLAAECARSRGDVSQAMEDLESVAKDDLDSWIAATILKADILHYDLADFQRAETEYLQVLKVDPNHVPANSGYSRLLGLCGRRRDAIPHILRLIQQSAADDLLVLLSRQEGALTDPELIAKAEQTFPEDPNLLLAKANLAILSLDHELAIKYLKTARSKPNASALVLGRLGGELLAADRRKELTEWARKLPPADEWGAETWLIVGQIAEQQDNVEGAIRCYWETLKRWPESLKATSRLATLQKVQGDIEEASYMQDRVTSITRLREAQRQTIMSSQTPSAAEMLNVISAYAECGRIAEAFAWGQMASQVLSNENKLTQNLSEWAEQLSSEALSLTAPKFNPALRLDYSNLAIPTNLIAHQAEGQRGQSHKIEFKKETESAGFRFTYFNGVTKPTRRMFEFTGGGIGVIDLDNDDWPDLFCSQGVPWGDGDRPATQPSDSAANIDSPNDTVFRNLRGNQFGVAEFDTVVPREFGFGQGISVGDANNDGFQDLYVANTHRNQLLINNGDGTFSESEGFSDNVAAWTTSCLIADLNGDSAPDLYDVNYLKGDDLFTRVCEQDDGQPLMCGPEAFEGAADQIWLSQGDGRYIKASEDFLTPAPTGKGLGIVALRQGQPSLSLFVANDTVANHFYTADSVTEAAITTRMRDNAFAYGLAVNGDGKSEACMGIAVADINGDQRQDLVVTNFLHESNTVYASLSDTLFQDQTRLAGLQEASLPVLSFGTQFLDANKDGRQELFVGNGYTEDMPGDDIPYAMRPQLFEWTRENFQQLSPDAIGTWATEEFVARAVVRLDWNGDQLPDLAVGVLHAPSFLLTNRSDASAETGLTIRFVATGSARDGIGTTVTSSIDDHTQTLQVTAGDGYQCSNQRVLHLSGFQQDQIAELQVNWPSGETQIFRDVSAAGSWVAIEGRPELSLIPKNFD